MLSQKGDKYGSKTQAEWGVPATYQPNSDADWIVNRANEIFQGQGKGKNPLTALNQATKDLETAKQQMKEEESRARQLQGQQDMGAFKGYAGQKGPITTPSTPTQPTAVQKVQQMTNEQKIQILRQRGVSEEEIQKALQNR
jgi:hypothetical protein